MEYDIAIIGLGPAGHKMALLAQKEGKKVVVFEKNLPGGTCLNLGCIPTKAIIHDSLKPDFNWQEAMGRKDGITKKFNSAIEKDLKNKGIEIIYGEARIAQNTILCNGKKCEADKIIIATGSKPLEIKGLEFDHDFILSSDDLFALDEPPKSILIVGSGAIGIEWARIFNAIGTEVYMAELAPNLLPNADVDVSKRVERLFKMKKIKFFTNTTVKTPKKEGVELSSGMILNVNKILVAAGRKKVLPEINGAALEIKKDFSTNFKNIYAIGDVAPYPMLAHSASAQAANLGALIFKNNEKHLDYKKIPSVVYGVPEIASIGLREQDTNPEECRIYNLPIAYLTKSWCDNNIDGFIKIITKNDLILGAHIVSLEASSLITQIATAMEANMTVEELKNIIYPHPTYSEGILEALENG